MRIFVVTTALALAVSVGCGGNAKSLEREWKQKTKKDTSALAEQLRELNGTLDRVQRSFKAELKKTGPKRALYNPGMFGRLGRMAEKLDLSKPQRKERLRRAGWMTHYRFVTGAGRWLTKLHRFVALLRQLKASLDLGRSQEQKFGKQLEARKPGWTPITKRHKPAFGVIIRDNKHVLFTGSLGDPVRRDTGDKCVKADLQSAEGYRLSDGKCYWFTQSVKKGVCPQVNGTLRAFANNDKELTDALRCLSMADVLMEGFRFRLLDLELVLAELRLLDVKSLAASLQSAGGN